MIQIPQWALTKIKAATPNDIMTATIFTAVILGGAWQTRSVWVPYSHVAEDHDTLQAHSIQLDKIDKKLTVLDTRTQDILDLMHGGVSATQPDRTLTLGIR